MTRIFKVDERTTDFPKRTARFYIGIDDLSLQRKQNVVIGRYFESLAELEALAKEIKDDLDRAIEEARLRFG